MDVVIYDHNGTAKATVTAKQGSTASASLMESDYIQLEFVLASPKKFVIGDYCVVKVCGKDKKFVVNDFAFPTYNTSTGGWEYKIQMDAWYYAWNRYTLRLCPDYGAINTSFGYTNTFEEHLRIIFSSLYSIVAKGDSSIELPTDVIVHSLVKNTDTNTYHEQKDRYIITNGVMTKDTNGYPIVDTEEIDYYSNLASCLVDSSVKYVSYDNKKHLEAITELCGESAFDCEWWMDGNTLHFGRCENGTQITIENDVDGVMSYSRSSNEYATRLIAYGSTTNVPSRYRKRLIFKVMSNSNGSIDTARPMLACYFKEEFRTKKAGTFGGSITKSGQDIVGAFIIPKRSFSGGQRLRVTFGNLTFKRAYTNENDWHNFDALVRDAEIVIDLYDSSDAIVDTITISHKTTSNERYTDSGTEYTRTTAVFKETLVDTLSTAKAISVHIGNVSKSSLLSNASMNIAMSASYEFYRIDTKVKVLTGTNKDSIIPVTINEEFIDPTFKASAYIVGLSSLSLGDTYVFVDNDGVESGSVEVFDVPVSYFTDEYGQNSVSSFERRLMLPKDKCPYNFIDAVTDNTQIVETTKVFDDIYPKMDLKIARVKWYKEKVTNSDENGDTYYTYQVRFEIYIAKNDLNFSKKYLIDKNLQCVFQSGKLAGQTFDLEFKGDSSEKNASGTYKGADLQAYRIVTSSDNGISIPNELICPVGATNVIIDNLVNTTPDVGNITEKQDTPDHIVLVNYNAKSITELGLVDNAEEELYKMAKAYLDKISVIEGTYTANMFWSFFANRAQVPGIGQKVAVKDAGYFGNELKKSRIIGYSFSIDKEIDNHTYTIGETQKYSRLGALEKANSGSTGIASINTIQNTSNGSDGDEETHNTSNNTRRWGWYICSAAPTTAAYVEMIIRNGNNSDVIGNGINKTFEAKNWKCLVVCFPSSNTIDTFKRTDVVEDWLQDTDYTFVSEIDNVSSGQGDEKTKYTIYTRKVISTVSSANVHVEIK